MSSWSRFTIVGLLTLGVGLLVLPFVDERRAGAAPERDPIAVQRGDAESLLGRKTKAQPVIRRGLPARFRNRAVAVGHGATEPLGSIARSAFRSQEALRTRLRTIKRSSGILVGAPITRGETFEFPDSYLLVQCTSITVARPERLAAISPQFRSYLGKRRSEPVDLSSLEAESRAGLNAFIKTELPRRPANDPLRLAARGGKAAVLEAILAGKGLFEIIDEVIVPKRLPPLVDGLPQLPAFGAGVFDYGTYRPITAARLRAIGPVRHLGRLPGGRVPALADGRTSGTSGRSTHMARVRRGMRKLFDAQFMAGFTLSSNWEWSRTWRFESGLFRAKLGAGYALGLRFPLRVRGHVDPGRITVTGPSDVPTKFEAQITAEPFDADRAYYRSVGVGADEPDETCGKELALFFGFGYGYKFRALYTTVKHRRYRMRYGIDHSADFTPPFGNDGAGGIPIWIPPEVTGTAFDWVVLRGHMKAGVRISGRGTVGLDYESFHGDTKRNRSLRFSSTEPRTVTTTLPRLDPASGTDTASEAYGFRLHRPVYRIHPTLTPGVEVWVRVGYRGLKRTFSTGAIWIRALEMPIPPVTFGRHLGTPSELAWRDGRKIFRRQTP